jgi:hypothetical protein
MHKDRVVGAAGQRMERPVRKKTISVKTDKLLD